MLWLVAALVTAHRLGHEMDVVFDTGLEATAQRILPLALHDLRRARGGDHEQDDDHEVKDERAGRLNDVGKDITYVVRDRHGNVLLRSDGARDQTFPPFDGVGFRQTTTHRLYYDAAHEGGITIAVAEPLKHRAETSRAMLVSMILPLLIVIPLSLSAIVVAVRRGFPARARPSPGSGATRRAGPFAPAAYGTAD